MKQFDVKEKEIGGNKFFIRPFPALVAANISGDLAAAVVPILGAIAPLASKINGSANLLDMNAEEAMPVITEAAANLSGDRIEYLMKKLLINHMNISVEIAGSQQTETLAEDLLNEIFCGDIQDMFLLAFEVIRINFAGFFGKLGSQYGVALKQKMTVLPSMSNSASST